MVDGVSSRLPREGHTPLCDLLGIEAPIILAGMAYAADVELTAAVSNAGGLGVLGSTGDKPEEIREKIRAIRKLTKKPFGVDVILPPTVSRDIAIPDNIMAMVPPEYKDYIRELRKRFNVPETEESQKIDFHIMGTGAAAQVEVILEEKVPVFASGLGSPGFMVDRAHAQGMKVMAVVGNVRAAKKVLADKVDVIIAQGYDGGGHTGQVGTFSLLPQVVEVAGKVPVVAAGGVASASGLAAALAFGCQGVWVGTRFLATKEAAIAQWRKEGIVAATEDSTVRSRSYTGKPARMIKNEWTEAWEKGPLQPLPMPLQHLMITPVMQDAGENPRIGANASGQGCGLIHDIKPAAEIVREMVEGAAEILERVSGAYVKSAAAV
ncbi:nitronate monooxygenase [Candidatus Sumerlaeota bacterium]|nr:nitronate monooxygenase [Candidatus Sumerlaeota bacterium]